MIINKTNKRNNKLVFIFRMLVVLLVIVVLLIIYLSSRANSDSASNNKEAVLKAVSRLMVLPDETGVVVATVSDREKLTGQDFFRLSQNGDKVIVFPQAHQAVLYRPKVDKIVMTAPLAEAQPEQNGR